MKDSCREYRKQKLQQRGCSRGLCCSCRISVSSSEETDSSSSCGARFGSISSLSHAMVQERLEQMIRGRQEEARKSERRRLKRREGSTKFVVMVAMEKCSYDPREDFRESMVEMIMANRMEDPKDLRRLLNYYMSMNSQDYHGIILEVFHEKTTGRQIKRESDLQSTKSNIQDVLATGLAKTGAIKTGCNRRLWAGRKNVSWRLQQTNWI